MGGPPSSAGRRPSGRTSNQVVEKFLRFLLRLRAIKPFADMPGCRRAPLLLCLEETFSAYVRGHGRGIAYEDGFVVHFHLGLVTAELLDFHFRCLRSRFFLWIWLRVLPTLAGRYRLFFDRPPLTVAIEGQALSASCAPDFFAFLCCVAGP